MGKLKLNPSVAYRKKNGVYVFYYDFNYLFFVKEAAKLVDKLLEIIENKKKLYLLPDSFLKYLISKKILLEE
jgi:hypothetical protein